MIPGVTRRVDELGRIVLPVEVRRNLGIEERDELMIELDGNRVVLEKFHPSCIFCNSMADMITYKGRKVCRVCINGLGANS